jgi:hypothetical protein
MKNKQSTQHIQQNYFPYTSVTTLLPYFGMNTVGRKMLVVFVLCSTSSSSSCRSLVILGFFCLFVCLLGCLMDVFARVLFWGLLDYHNIIC